MVSPEFKTQYHEKRCKVFYNDALEGGKVQARIGKVTGADNLYIYVESVGIPHARVVRIEVAE